MKYINAATRTLVEFSPAGEPQPVYFQYKGRRLKIDSILEIRMDRRAFCSCAIYKCRSGEQLLELRWDKVHDKWFIDKIE